jgi:hypothetical protein
MTGIDALWRGGQMDRVVVYPELSTVKQKKERLKWSNVMRKIYYVPECNF